LLTSVNYLTGRVSAPILQEDAKLQRILNYLNSTCDMGLTLSCDTDIVLTAYVDASDAVHSEFRSHTGALIKLGKGTIWVKSTEQKLTPRSSTEAEIVAVSDSLSQILWARDFLLE
jgi:hypothetical protein